MSVNVSKIIDAGATRIRKAVSKFDQATDSKIKAKARIEIKSALKDYCHDLVLLKTNKDIFEDPYGIIYAKGLKHTFMVYMVIDSLYELRDDNENMCSAIDSIMSDAVKAGHMSKWVILYKDGTRVVLTSKAVTFIVDGVETVVSWSKSVAMDLIKWLKLQWEKLVSKSSKSVGGDLGHPIMA